MVKLLKGKLEQVMRDRLSTENIAVFLIDMQSDKLIERNVKHEPRYLDIVKRQKELLEFAISLNMPIFIFEISPEEYGHTLSTLLEPVANYERVEIIVKESSGAFMGSNVGKKLKPLNVRTVLVMGEVAGVCVLHTLLDAEERGLSTITSPSVIVQFDNSEGNIYDFSFGAGMLKLCEMYDDR